MNNIGMSCNNIMESIPLVLAPSSINLIDWDNILFNALKHASFFSDIKYGSILLVNMIKNNTHEALEVNKITDILIKCILKNVKTYNVINMNQMNVAYRKLGMFPENHINSYSFSEKIADYLKADYILYGMVHGCSEEPIVELQLILVKTGEIISSVKSESYR